MQLQHATAQLQMQLVLARTLIAVGMPASSVDRVCLAQAGTHAEVCLAYCV
jgi:hypothetical protein